MKDSRNFKLAKNLGLMFLVYFLPKIFSFFLVPLYTTYLTTDEYGISDLIMNTAALIAPFIALSLPGAVMRFTIENKEDNRTIWIALYVYVRGLLLLLLMLSIAYIVSDIPLPYLVYVFIIAASSVLADINLSYSRGLERVSVVTICGVGSSLISLVSNVLFIVVFRLGVYGFLLASLMGYFYNITLSVVCNRKQIFGKIEWDDKAKKLKNEMLQFSIPTIFSGISWWVISSSDRYFVTAMCGVSENGLYSVAYKIPVILKAIDNVFYQAWIYSLYDSYKQEEGREYIVKVYDVYNFILCFIGSVIICYVRFIAKYLFSNDFFQAWKYVPLLLISVLLSSGGGLTGNFLTVYKKTKTSFWISIIAAIINIILNYLFIVITKNAMGAAIATTVTFFVSWGLYNYWGILYSGIKVKWEKSLLMYGILIAQTAVILLGYSTGFAMIFCFVVLVINYKTIVWAIEKWRIIKEHGNNNNKYLDT